MATGPHTSVTHDDFIPEIWVAKTIDAFEKNLLARQLFEDWSAYFSAGGKKAYIPIFKNLATTDAAAIPETTEAYYASTASTSDKLTLEIDQSKYVSVELTDELTTFSNLDLVSKWSAKLAYPLAQLVDAFFFETLTDATGNTAIDAHGLSSITDDDLLVLLKNAKRTLDLKDVPKEGRRWVFDPELANRQAIVKRLSSADYVSGRPIETGAVGMLLGSPVFMSNNLHTGTYSGVSATYNLYFHESALAYAFGPSPLEVLYRPNDAHWVHKKLTAKVRYGAKSVTRDGTNNFDTVNILVTP